MDRLALYFPLLALGPLSAPLAKGLASYGRAGRWGMAMLCAIGILGVWLGLPAFLAGELGFITYDL